jgi:GntR family transcriptional repressor for pyruvate dehydrogenase complex
MIQQAHYKPGDRLPSIAEMARRFGVGHPTVREALQKLDTVAMIEIRHGSGVYVRQPPDTLLMTNPIFGVPASKKLLLDLIEARIPIEVQSAVLAARNATEEHFAEMRRLLETAGENLGEDAVLNLVNMGFHREIARSSGNAVIAQLLEVLSNLFCQEQRVILGIYGFRDKDHVEHMGILAALEQRDEVRSAERMRVHLEGVRSALLLWEPGETPLPREERT